MKGHDKKGVRRAQGLKQGTCRSLVARCDRVYVGLARKDIVNDGSAPGTWSVSGCRWLWHEAR